MLNEWQEFLDYTGEVRYCASSKSDTTWCGRFSFEALLDLNGLVRILTIVARRYLFHGEDGGVLSNEPRERVELALRALCAWCSIPDNESAKRESWNHRTDFRELHCDFPGLVDEDGRGWFYRHFCAAMSFAVENPDLVRRGYPEKASAALAKFPQEWRKKVVAAQYSVYDSSTKATWLMRFDDVLADALELGPLRDREIKLSDEAERRVLELLPENFPAKHAHMIFAMLAYYIANKPADSDWVVLPVVNFDCYFGDSSFSHTYLARVPEEVVEREYRGGVSRYRIHMHFLS